MTYILTAIIFALSMFGLSFLFEYLSKKLDYQDISKTFITYLKWAVLFLITYFAKVVYWKYPASLVYLMLTTPSDSWEIEFWQFLLLLIFVFLWVSANLLGALTSFAENNAKYGLCLLTAFYTVLSVEALIGISTKLDGNELLDEYIYNQFFSNSFMFLSCLFSLLFFMYNRYNPYIKRG